MLNRVFFGVLLVISSVNADEVLIQDSRCVEANVQKVHDSITDYDHYSSLPGAAYHITFMGKHKLLEMIKSKSIESKVWVVLRPTNLTYESLYPRFQLNCTAHWSQEQSQVQKTRFEHKCKLDASVEHYGLSDFDSHLNAFEDSKLCAVGETRLEYTLKMQGIAADIEEIKKAVLKPAGPIAPVIGRLFNEDAFFKNYYENFYEGWAGQLQ